LSKAASQRPTAAEAGTALLQIATRKTAPAIVGTDRQSIAVVPFRLRNAAPEDQFMSIALADAVIHRLGSTGKLIVRPLGAVVRYAGGELDWTHVARELNTDLVVEGTILDPRFAGSLVSKAHIALETGNAEQSAELYERLLE
jgi:TolB-like protein